MKKVFHKISSVCLALIVLLSTVSFTIDSHYCGDTLVDSSLFGHVETCGMDKQLSRNDCQSEVQDDSCCSDKQLVVEGQDDLKMSFNTLNFEQQVFVVSFVHSYINLFETLDSHIVPFRDYTPPYLVRNVQKLHETYLI
ncbi:MAG: hypothetical protein CMP12_01750 [Zunongwangia sp.]|uniref:Secreted protein n=1 Tax=Zunongwangia profunda (strain DSM 18752 / CCTCC AB 206139 / SM-A87) TaxID=655815 RepID=D5BJ70_ZUNPS|nr:hypothetical protein [Zunongwangia profunda]ADF53703.1 conserved hypothetical protein [Zunongwangia profunda SM-A87]MAG86112.1 hypothetical protein [Flavobacteriaceae bacterium]MAO34632.1 hypothetical protein [Zunongwangia sp.]MAS72864.1 hypothetical protein [Zunongwangia sp.]|tara:strand:- start:222 stop:638 length:417 start_codon:yes stop_codon:yes gene_type:complete